MTIKKTIMRVYAAKDFWPEPQCEALENLLAKHHINEAMDLELEYD